MHNRIDVFTNIFRSLNAKSSQEQIVECGSNPVWDLAALEEIVNDESPMVRSAAAQHPSAISFVWKLVNDESSLVRYVLAMNRDLPEHVYEILAGDENHRVAKRAKRTLQIIKRDDSVVGQLLAHASARKLAV